MPPNRPGGGCASRSQSHSCDPTVIYSKASVVSVFKTADISARVIHQPFECLSAQGNKKESNSRQLVRLPIPTALIYL